jgi:hypothetical protein
MNKITGKEWVIIIILGGIMGGVQGVAAPYVKVWWHNTFHSATADKSTWVTYTNEFFGYEISYPSNAEVIYSSDLPAIEEDQHLFIHSSTGDFFTVGAGLLVNYTATNTADTIERYKEIVIPKFIESPIGEEKKYPLLTILKLTK